MSDLIDLLKLLGDGLGKLISTEETQKKTVAQHFLNLSHTLNAFLPAARDQNFDEMKRLEGKTEGLLDSLRQTKSIERVLGADHAKEFFATLASVSNAKSLAAAGGAADLDIIIKAAGYFEAYHETL